MNARRPARRGFFAEMARAIADALADAANAIRRPNMEDERPAAAAVRYPTDELAGRRRKRRRR